MLAAADLVRIADEFFIWQMYDPRVKADLFSTAARTSAGLYLFDPIALNEEALSELLLTDPVVGIVLTNVNHLRDSARFVAKLGIPIFARSESHWNQGGLDFRTIEDGQKLPGELQIFEIDGAAGGEIAVYLKSNRGTLIVGDALINLEPNGFTFLPAKYCTDQKRMRQSLRKFLDYEIERILFAHGSPILSAGGTCLRQMLDVDRKESWLDTINRRIDNVK